MRDKPAKQKFSLITDKEPAKKIGDAKKEKKESPEMKVIKGGDDLPARVAPQGTPTIIPTKQPQPVGKPEAKVKKALENKKIEVEIKDVKERKEQKEAKKEIIKKEIGRMEKDEKREEEPRKPIEAPPATRQEGEKIIAPPAKEAKPRKKEAKSAKPGKIDAKSKITESKKAKQSPVEKKETVIKSSPTTPKKTMNGVATKTEISKAVKKMPPVHKIEVAPPAKSTKDANNRKVVEQKKSAIKETGVTAAVKVTAKPKPMDRKPIGRRKPVSPSKVRLFGSPAKSTRSTPTTSVKSDKDGVVARRAKGEKGTADSSTVSTPSGIEAEAGGRLAEKSLMEQSEDISLDSIESKVLADLKEEREVVEEIEAVLQKAERIEETRKDDRSEGDDEITAELTDKKEEDITDDDIIEPDMEEALKREMIDEYLIVEKEEDYIEDSTRAGRASRNISWTRLNRRRRRC